MDTGGLSFDTQWYDWGPYAKAMLAKIRRHWRIPDIAMLGVEGVVKIRFYIERDGTVTGLQILDVAAEEVAKQRVMPVQVEVNDASPRKTSTPSSSR